MSKNAIKLTGKIKKLECVKGTDRLVIENLDFKADGLYEIKQAANEEEAVKVEITVIQDKLPGIE